MKNSKILFVSEYAGIIGGLERYVFNTANLLKKRGCKVYGLFAKEAQNKDLFLSAFDKHWKFSEFNQIDENFDSVTVHKLYDFKNFQKILSRYEVTLFVHAHDYYCPKGYKYFLIGRENCVRKYKPFFCALCSSIVPPRQLTEDGLLKKHFVDWPKLFKCFCSCKNYVVISNFMKAQLLNNGIPEHKIRVINPVIETTDRISKGSENGNEILFSGQQVMSKGTPLFLDACSKITIPFHANIVGNGLRLDDFKKLPAQMGLDGKVEFRGWVNNVEDYISNADVFAFPSLWQEPFGLAGVEAMAQGVPVVGFDVGGVKEWLVEGCGFLVPERDTSAMAEKLQLIMEDKTLRNEMGKRARRHVSEHYGEENFAKSFESLIGENK